MNSLLKTLILLIICSTILLMPNNKLSAEKKAGGETRPPLSPFTFRGKTAYAYQIANEIPEILDKIYCYCHCAENYNHKSLLSCFIDRHAAFCDICQDEAIRAYELHKQKKDANSIIKIIDDEFAR